MLRPVRATMRAVEMGVETGTRLKLQNLFRFIQRPDSCERGIKVSNECRLQSPVFSLGMSMSQGHADLRDQGCQAGALRQREFHAAAFGDLAFQIGGVVQQSAYRLPFDRFRPTCDATIYRPGLVLVAELMAADFVDEAKPSEDSVGDAIEPRATHGRAGIGTRNQWLPGHRSGSVSVGGDRHRGHLSGGGPQLWRPEPRGCLRVHAAREQMPEPLAVAVHAADDGISAP